MTPTLLDDAVLARFDRALVSVGASVVRHLGAGLAEQEIQRQAGMHGLRMPDEAIRWWEWHNGVRADTQAPHWDVVPRRSLLDLGTTLDEFAHARGAIEQLEGATARLSPVSGDPWLFFDCSGAPDDPVPIYVGGHGEPQRPALPSIGELVLVWTELIEDGAFRTAADGTWEWDFERIPERVRQLGVY